MTIQPIGAASVAVYLTAEDLQGRGLTPRSLTREAALALTHEAFAQAGIAPAGTMEIEAYPETCGVLVFARFQPPGRVWFFFPDIEAVLTAARSLAPLCPDARLVWCDDGYWLSVPAGQDRLVCRLSEFGRPAEGAPFLEAQLAEHGHTLISGGALDLLLRYFPEEMV